MITAKIGEKFVNCFDGGHSRETLKTWADKGILKCPACGKEYEYCHGRVVRPYFRHKEKTDCVDKYSEPETNEHIQGKIALYNWIKDQEGVTDVILEAWIPETRQRPDIAFKYNGEQYVFEFQCSPISTVYLERHELYQAAGINDIWILGTEKYSNKHSRGKFIEQFAIGSYNVERNHFSYIHAIDIEDLPYKILIPPVLWGRNFDELIFDKRIKAKQEILNKYIEKDIKLCEKKQNEDKVKYNSSLIYNKCRKMISQYDNLSYGHILNISYKNTHSVGEYCRVSVEFSCEYCYLFFKIFDYKIDVYVIKDYKLTLIDDFLYDSLDEMYIKLTAYIGDRIRENMYRSKRSNING